MQTQETVYSNRSIQARLCLWQPLEGITIKLSQVNAIQVKIYQNIPAFAMNPTLVLGCGGDLAPGTVRLIK